mgnify:CR=1 FL=1
MTRADQTRIPPRGRRATILRAAVDRSLTLSDLVRRVRNIDALRGTDPSIDRIKTGGAVRDMRRHGLLVRTPHGYRTTGAGLDLLRASEDHHA